MRGSRPPARAAAPVSRSTVDPFEAAPRWRFQGRDLVALAAIAVAVWFAIRGAEGLPFHQSGSLAPAEAADGVAARVTLDRQQLASLPRAAFTQVVERKATGGIAGADASSPSGSGSGSGSGSKGQPKPPSGGSRDDPLVEATIPGVGTVTIENPDLPSVDDAVASLPLSDADELTETLP